jgi:hypothetical protein
VITVLTALALALVVLRVGAAAAAALRCAAQVRSSAAFKVAGVAAHMTPDITLRQLLPCIRELVQVQGLPPALPTPFPAASASSPALMRWRSLER